MLRVHVVQPVLQQLERPASSPHLGHEGAPRSVRRRDVDGAEPRLRPEVELPSLAGLQRQSQRPGAVAGVEQLDLVRTAGR